MNIIEYAILKKMLGESGGGSGATAYHLPSINDLPTSAVNGSIAIVENDDILGCWLFTAFQQSPQSFNLDFNFHIYDASGNIRNCYNMYCANEEIAYVELDENELVAYMDNEWQGYEYRKIYISETPPQKAENYIRENAKKLNSLYTRENGEWVYKGTTSEAISAEYY